MTHELESEMSSALKTPNLIKRAQSTGTVSHNDFTEAQWDRMLGHHDLPFPRTLVRVIADNRFSNGMTATQEGRRGYILARKAQGVKQGAIALELDISPGLVSKILNKKLGRPPRAQ